MSQASAQLAGGARIPLAPHDRRTSRRRTLDERLGVRFPILYRLLADASLRLPPGSRRRRFLLARRVSQGYAAANRHDFDVVLAGWDRESEYRPSSDLMPPDLETVFHGHDGYRRLWRYWLDAFDDIRWDPEEILDFGGSLLVTTQLRGHGSGSGVAVAKPIFQVFTLRRGLVVRQEDFVDREQALEAARWASQDRAIGLAGEGDSRGQLG